MKKSIIKRSGIILLLMVVVVAGIVVYDSLDKDMDIEDEDMPLGYTLDRKSQKIIDDLKTVEGIIEDELGIYDVETINNATMGFIRSKRYGYRSSGMSSMMWKTYAGDIKAETGIDVDEEKEIVSQILELTDEMKEMTDPATGAAIDFPHLVAVIDVEYTDIDEEDYLEEYMDFFLAWGGDLETFLLDMIDFSDSSGEDSYESMYNFAKSMIGSTERSYFSEEDFYADIDAVNIQRMMEEEGLLLSEALEEYYSGGGFTDRYEDFLDAHEGATAFEDAVNAFMLNEVPDEYTNDEDFIKYLKSIQSLKRMMRILVYDETEDPSEISREAAVAAFLEKVNQ